MIKTISELWSMIDEEKYDDVINEVGSIDQQNEGEKLCILGYCYYFNESYRESVEAFKKAKESFDSYLPNYFLGKIYAESKDYKDSKLAIENFEEIVDSIKLDEHLIYAKLKLAKLYLQKKNISNKDVFKAKNWLEHLVGIGVLTTFEPEDEEEDEEVEDYEFDAYLIEAIDILVAVYMALGESYKVENISAQLRKMDSDPKYHALYHIGALYFKDDDIRASFLGESCRTREGFIEYLKQQYDTYDKNAIDSIVQRFKTLKRDVDINDIQSLPKIN